MKQPMSVAQNDVQKETCIVMYFYMAETKLHVNLSDVNSQSEPIM